MDGRMPAAPASFGAYAACYDLLYADKDYAAEAERVARIVRAARRGARRILEFGAGTGRHGRLLAERGFDVQGIERSPDMLEVARARCGPTPASAAAPAGSFQCSLGDVRTARADGPFDAVVAMFHVVSYQADDASLRDTFANAERHLVSGGLFLFDVWHGPAVLSQRPEARTKRVASDALEVVRHAAPTLDTATRTVRVDYNIECRDTATQVTTRFAERHVLRYLFPAEIDRLAEDAGLVCIAAEEFATGRPPSDATWGVLYVLRKP